MDKKIRYLELNILDEEYKKYNLVYRPENQVLLLLFQLLGDIWRHISNNKLDLSYLQSSYTMIHSIDGIGHCIRWVSKHSQQKIIIPASSLNVIHEEATNLFLWSQKYNQLCLYTR